MPADERAPRPLVGLTADREEKGSFSVLPHYALRENYADSLFRAGASPLILPHHPEEAERLLDLLDGLVVTGGAFDVDPALFGAEERHPSVVLKARRTAFEKAIIEGALARDMPILGICGGEQLLNVVLGGTLIQDIETAMAEALAHEQPNPPDEPGHDVTIAERGLLRDLVGCDRMRVNSAHHQAVERPGEGVRVVGRAADGLIEAIEAPERRFCLGVQWHPEYEVDPGDRKILEGFVAAASAYRRAREAA